MTEKPKIWFCKIGAATNSELPFGADAPMREAVEQAFHAITGRWSDFNFSGWGGELTEPERAVVEDRLPVCPACGLSYDEQHGDCKVCGGAIEPLESLQDELDSTTAMICRYRQALRLIAAPVRPDGTYNRSREACEQLAKKALDD